MMHISASAAPIRVKQKPLYSKLSAESDKYYYESLCKSLENSPESLVGVLYRKFVLRSNANFVSCDSCVA